MSTKIQFICLLCEKHFEIADYNVRNTQRITGKNPQFCSSRCYGDSMKGKPRRFEYNGPGYYIHSRGYKVIRIGPNHWDYEHRAVMEGLVGRPLLPDEYVHHKNGDRTDNRPENLEIMTPQEHADHHDLGRVRE